MTGSGTSLSATVMKTVGAEGLHEFTATEELVESTTIEELDCTLRTESGGVAAEDLVRDFMMKGQEIWSS